MIRKYTSNAFDGNKLVKWLDFLDNQLKWPVSFDRVAENSFHAEVEFFSIGSVALINHSISPLIVERKGAHTAHVPEQNFTLNLLKKGRVILSHHARQNALAPGTIVLANSAMPSTLTFDQPSHLLTVRIPGQLLKSCLPGVEAYCNQPLSAADGFTNALREILLTLWQRGQEGAGDELMNMSIRPMLDLLALACLTEHSGRNQNISADSRQASIKKFIRDNIANPSLSPELIALEFKLSTRYLRKLFAAEGDSTSRYIQRCRLESCADQLANIYWRNSSITDICFRCGFNSSAHFTRSFKAQYGVTPREYRRHLLKRQAA